MDGLSCFLRCFSSHLGGTICALRKYCPITHYLLIKRLPYDYGFSLVKSRSYMWPLPYKMRKGWEWMWHERSALSMEERERERDKSCESRGWWWRIVVGLIESHMNARGRPAATAKGGLHNNNHGQVGTSLSLCIYDLNKLIIIPLKL